MCSVFRHISPDEQIDGAVICRGHVTCHPVPEYCARLSVSAMALQSLQEHVRHLPDFARTEDQWLNIDQMIAIMVKQESLSLKAACTQLLHCSSGRTLVRSR
jgi:hypothetical protein